MATPKKPKAKPAAAKKAPARKTKAAPARKMAARRADYGAPVDAFFARQPPHLRPVLDALRAMVEQAAPGASASLKWGMPFYTLGGQTVCALSAHKAHVNLILPGAAAFADPGDLLEGESKLGRHLKLRSLDELPRDAVRGWLRAAVEHARKRG